MASSTITNSGTLPGGLGQAVKFYLADPTGIAAGISLSIASATGTWTMTVNNVTGLLVLGVTTGGNLSGAYASGDVVTWTTASTFTVTGATNATPIVVTTSAPHGIKDGQFIVITGVGGNTAANGLWQAKAASTTTIILVGSVGNSNYTSGGTASPVSGGSYNGITGQVKDQTTTTGTGTITMTGVPIAGFLSSAFLDDGQTYAYQIDELTAGVPNGTWEQGTGIFTKASLTLTRSVAVTNSGPTTTPLTLPSGTAAVSITVSAPPEIQKGVPPQIVDELPPIGLGSLGQVTGGGGPNGSIVRLATQCRLQMNTTQTNSDQLRLGSGGSVYLVPIPYPSINGRPPPPGPYLGSITLFFVNPTTRSGTWVNVSFTTPPSCALGSSNVPFTFTGGGANYLPSQATVATGVPADIFAFLPIGNSSAIPAPQLFFLNWSSQTARQSIIGGNNCGHALYQSPSCPFSPALFLDMSGAWNPNRSGGASLPGTPWPMYLYLGTVGSLTAANGTGVCTNFARGLWNMYNALGYDAVGKDTNPFWDLAGTGSTYLTNMDIGGAAGTDIPPWYFEYVLPPEGGARGPYIAATALRFSVPDIAIDYDDGTQITVSPAAPPRFQPIWSQAVAGLPSAVLAIVGVNLPAQGPPVGGAPNGCHSYQAKAVVYDAQWQRFYGDQNQSCSAPPGAPLNVPSTHTAVGPPSPCEFEANGSC